MTAYPLDAAAYDATRPSGSFWHDGETVAAPPLAGGTRAEVAVVGGGVVGLNAALRLVEAHGADVVLLEAGSIGWGASGRNGGFCCDGATKLEPRTLGRLEAPDGAFAAPGWHGNGIAMGSKAGALVADLALGKLRAEDLPLPLARPLRPFPLPRRWLVRGLHAWLGFTDGPLKAGP